VLPPHFPISLSFCCSNLVYFTLAKLLHREVIWTPVSCMRGLQSLFNDMFCLRVVSSMTGGSTDPYIGVGRQPRNNPHPRNLGDNLEIWAKNWVLHVLLVHRPRRCFILIRPSGTVTLLLKNSSLSETRLVSFLAVCICTAQ
jgi:hypothetical protein